VASGKEGEKEVVDAWGQKGQGGAVGKAANVSEDGKKEQEKAGGKGTKS